MPFVEAGAVRIHYEEAGQGFPLLIIPGGGLDSTIDFLRTRAAFDPFVAFGDSYRCIAADLRNARDGLSTGPLETDSPWDAFTDDHLRLLDHLEIDRCFVLGFCIGGPLLWNLIRKAPARVAAAVLADPSGVDPAHPDFFYKYYRKTWAPEFFERRPEVQWRTWRRSWPPSTGQIRISC
jgi:pimeloyl-ACP methyl ester carboxylesterase